MGTRYVRHMTIGERADHYDTIRDAAFEAICIKEQSDFEVERLRFTWINEDSQLTIRTSDVEHMGIGFVHLLGNVVRLQEDLHIERGHNEDSIELNVNILYEAGGSGDMVITIRTKESA